MGMPSNVVGQVYDLLRQIQGLAGEVESIPNFGPDVWTMKKGDEKCRQIYADAARISDDFQRYIGTGSGGMPSNVVGQVYDLLRQIQGLAGEVESIPNFGPDVWTMKKGDEKCRQIAADAAWVYAQTQRYIGTGLGDGPPAYGTGDGGYR